MDAFLLEIKTCRTGELLNLLWKTTTDWPYMDETRALHILTSSTCQSENILLSCTTRSIWRDWLRVLSKINSLPPLVTASEVRRVPSIRGRIFTIMSDRTPEISAKCSGTKWGIPAPRWRLRRKFRRLHKCKPLSWILRFAESLWGIRKIFQLKSGWYFLSRWFSFGVLVYLSWVKFMPRILHRMNL